MALRFDRLIMPDGRRAPIRAEIVELYHAPSGEKVDVEGAIESGGRGGKASLIPPSGRELAPCWAESSEGVREPGLGRSSAAPEDSALPRSTGARRSPSTMGRRC
jgi:hypothetical protein